jgi:predicted nucleic acid-binding protein
MTIQLDSDVIIDVLRGRDTVLLEHWRHLSDIDTNLLYSPISLAEVLAGARPSEAARIESLFSALIPIELSLEVARQSGQFLRRFRKSHGLELPDAMIAASAVSFGVPLWTRNLKHYPMKELVLYKP